MNVQLHIEHLTLDGWALTSYQGALVQAAVELELARLLRSDVRARLDASSATPVVHAGAMPMGSATHPAQFGNRIAAAVHSAIGSTTGGRR